MENTNLPKTYNPKDFESRLYSKWVEDGLFKSKPNPNKKPFTIMLPPPNITGQLHMGHALRPYFTRYTCKMEENGWI